MLFKRISEDGIFRLHECVNLNPTFPASLLVTLYSPASSRLSISVILFEQNKVHIVSLSRLHKQQNWLKPRIAF